MLLQIVLFTVFLLALAVTWRRARQSVISPVEALMWSLVWIAAGGVILLPQTTTIVANVFGIGRGADFVLYGSVVALFLLVFKLFVALDQVDRTLTELVRRDALKDIPDLHDHH